MKNREKEAFLGPQKCVVANRGEIACRILAAAKDKGYITAVISTVEDRGSLPRDLADTTLEVPHFLDEKAIVEVSTTWGAHFIHPGYGFLSEKASFAKLVEESGIIFVGPTSTSMELLGHKERSKQVAKEQNVPTLNALSSLGLKNIPQEKWADILKERGILVPYLVKASGGGGGRGMRIVNQASELPDALQRASLEAQTAFGDPSVFVEPYLLRPRHIEIQVFGDGQGGGVFFGERECSLQRRHQKILEESPSPVVGGDLRIAMGQAALRLVSAAKYKGAGTVEFLLDQKGQFYFLEMNTRLQVEHPVTELVYGIDLVKAQFDLAEGQWPERFPSPNIFSVAKPEGVALEARVLAENPNHQFLPTPGKIEVYLEPQAPYIRIDSGVRSGNSIQPQFDSLIAKLIVHGATRAQAVARLEKALGEYVILGCTTNLPFLQAICRNPAFLAGDVHTGWIAEQKEALTQSPLPEAFVKFFSDFSFRERLFYLYCQETQEDPIATPFYQLGKDLPFISQKNCLPYTIHKICPKKSLFSCKGPGVNALWEGLTKLETISSCLKEAFVNYHRTKKSEFFFTAANTNTNLKEIQIHLFGERLYLPNPYEGLKTPFDVHNNSGDVYAPMAGKIFEILAQEGQTILKDQIICIMESMKIQLEVRAPRTGRLRSLFITTHQVVPGAAPIAFIEES